MRMCVRYLTAVDADAALRVLVTASNDRSARVWELHAPATSLHAPCTPLQHFALGDLEVAQAVKLSSHVYCADIYQLSDTLHIRGSARLGSVAVSEVSLHVYLFMFQGISTVEGAEPAGAAGTGDAAGGEGARCVWSAGGGGSAGGAGVNCLAAHGHWVAAACR